MKAGDRVKVTRGFFAGSTGTIQGTVGPKYYGVNSYGGHRYEVLFSSGHVVCFRGASALRVLSPLEELAEALDAV